MCRIFFISLPVLVFPLVFFPEKKRFFFAMDSPQFSVGVGRGRGLRGAPIPFPDVSATVDRGMSMGTSTPFVGITPNLVHTQQDSPMTQATTPDQDVLDQMGYFVQHIGQQLADSIVTCLSRH